MQATDHRSSTGGRRTARRAGVVLLTLAALANLAFAKPGDLPTPDRAPDATEHAKAVLASHPRLLFDATDVGALRMRVQSGVPAQLWQGLEAKTEAYLDRTNVRYVDPEDQHTYGQNLQGTLLTDLGMAYVISGDARFGRLAIEMMLEGAAQNWPAWSNNELGRGGLTKGVALAFDWTYDLMTPAERRIITDALVAGLPALDPVTGEPRDAPGFSGVFSCLNRNHPWLDTAVHNWVGVCGGGNGLALLAIDGEPGVPDLTPWLTVARAHVLRYFGAGFGSAGDGAEGHTYAAYGLHNALPFDLAWERHSGESLVDLAPGVRNLVEWLVFEQLPYGGSRWPARNDAGTPNPLISEVLPFFFELRPGDGLVGWAWDHTLGTSGDDITTDDDTELVNPLWPDDPSCALPLDHSGEAASWTLFCARSGQVFNLLFYRSPSELPRVSPDASMPLGRHYPEFGLTNFRTGWGGPDEVAATFEVKRQARGHSQLDQGNFTIYGHGAAFAVDSGYGHNYSCRGNYAGQVLFGCTDTDPMTDNGRAVAHNVVLINTGKYSQTGLGRMTTDQTITEFVAGPTVSLARGDVSRSYVNATFGAAPWGERDFAFRDVPGDPTFVVVADRMRRSASEHTYQWTLHTDAEHTIGIVPDSTAGGLLGTPQVGGTFTVSTVEGATMTGAVADAHGPTALYVQPWDATRYMANPPLVHNVITSSTLLQRDLDHLAVLAISPPDGPRARMNPLPATGGTVIRAIGWTSEMRMASKARGATEVSVPGFSTDAELAMVTLHKGETLLTAGTTLVWGGRDYVTVTGSPATVTVGADTITADGPDGNGYRVYAPQTIDTVLVNGTAVPFTRAGNFVEFT